MRKITLAIIGTIAVVAVLCGAQIGINRSAAQPQHMAGPTTGSTCSDERNGHVGTADGRLGPAGFSAGNLDRVDTAFGRVDE